MNLNEEGFIFRKAVSADIPEMQVIRNSVKENKLSDPKLIKDADYEKFINAKGKGWVCEIENVIVGFGIANLEKHNIWALFVDPAFENKGIGYRLHYHMMRWYFSRTAVTVWLSTAPGTKAESFYRSLGWEEKGVYGKGEIKFEMSKQRWNEMHLALAI